MAIARVKKLNTNKSLIKNKVQSVLPLSEKETDMWYNYELKDIYDNFNKLNDSKKNITIGKEDLLKFLTAKNFTTDAKKKYIRTMPDNIDQATFVELLRYQTYGADYVNFDYLVKYYNLELDNNNMIIFIDKFPFDKRICKEALFVWSILKNIDKNANFSQFSPECFKFKLQNMLEYEDLSDIRKMKYDLCFPNLDIIIEIDEKHIDEGTIINDYKKDCLMQISGFNFTRLNFQKIYKGDLKDDTANAKMLNSDYYSKFLNDLCDRITNSLLHKSQSIRQHYIMKFFKDSLKNDGHNIMLLIKKYQDDKSRMYIDLEISQNEKDSEKILKAIKKLDSKIYDSILFLEDIRERLDNISEKSDFIKLFEMKEESKQKKNTIPFKKVIKLLKVASNDITKFKLFLYKQRIIEDIDQPNDTIFFTWIQLNLVISWYDSTNSIKKNLQLYFAQVETNYEIIIDLIEKHNASIRGNTKAVKVCMEQAYVKIEAELFKKVEAKYNNDLEKYKNLYEITLQKLNVYENKVYIKNPEFIKEFDEFDKEYKQLVESLNHNPYLISNNITTTYNSTVPDSSTYGSSSDQNLSTDSIVPDISDSEYSSAEELDEIE
jgi:hypothetical protein